MYLVLSLSHLCPSSGLASPSVRPSVQAFPFAAAALISDSAFASGRQAGGLSCPLPGQPVPSSVLYP